MRITTTCSRGFNFFRGNQPWASAMGCGDRARRFHPPTDREAGRKRSFRQSRLLKRWGKKFLQQIAFSLENISVYQELQHCKLLPLSHIFTTHEHRKPLQMEGGEMYRCINVLNAHLGGCRGNGKAQSPERKGKK